MTELKHSPRPWRLDEAAGFVLDADGRIVCQLWDKSEEDFDNREANGPVIAAAPDALGTCRDVLSDCFILRDLPGVGPGPQDFITAHLVAPLRLAIAGAPAPAAGRGLPEAARALLDALAPLLPGKCHREGVDTYAHRQGTCVWCNSIAAAARLREALEEEEGRYGSLPRFEKRRFF